MSAKVINGAWASIEPMHGVPMHGLMLVDDNATVLVQGDLADLEKFLKNVEAAVNSLRVLEEGRRAARRR